jgi:hypothetical protein
LNLSDIDLTGWTLSSTDGNPSINLAGTIPAKGFYLLERTDDDTVFDVTADQIYLGAGPSQNMITNGSSEKLELRDGSGYLIDSTPIGETWVAGIASSEEGYKTMERVTPYMPGDDPLFWRPTTALSSMVWRRTE